MGRAVLLPGYVQSYYSRLEHPLPSLPSAGSARLGSARLGSARLELAGVGSGRSVGHEPQTRSMSAALANAGHCIPMSGAQPMCTARKANDAFLATAADPPLPACCTWQQCGSTAEAERLLARGRLRCIASAA